MKDTIIECLKNIWFFFRVILICVDLFVATGLLYLFVIYFQMHIPTLLRPVTGLLSNIEFAKYSADVLSCALQVGRLDLVSMSLTLLAVVLALFGFAGFWMIRREASSAAEKATRVELKDIAPKEVKDFLRGEEGTEKMKQLLNDGVLSTILQSQEFVAKIKEALIPELRAEMMSFQTLENDLDADMDERSITKLIQYIDDGNTETNDDE